MQVNARERPCCLPSPRAPDIAGLCSLIPQGRRSISSPPVLTLPPTPNVHRAAEHGVKRRLLKWVRPDLFDALNDHKRAGRVVAILTGNLEPLVAPLARHLGCVCFSTGTECVTTDEGLAVYSGYLMGEPLLHTQKVRRALTDTGRYPDTCTLCVCVSSNHALYSRWPDATTIPATAPCCCFATLCPSLPHSL